MDDLINALGRFSHLFAGMNTAGNPHDLTMRAVHEGLDKLAMELAEKHSIDYGAMVNENLHNSTEYPTNADLEVLMSNTL